MEERGQPKALPPAGYTAAGSVPEAITCVTTQSANRKRKRPKSSRLASRQNSAIFITVLLSQIARGSLDVVAFVRQASDLGILPFTVLEGFPAPLRPCRVTRARARSAESEGGVGDFKDVSPAVCWNVAVTGRNLDKRYPPDWTKREDVSANIPSNSWEGRS